jgi:hypothetical protein
MELQRLARSFFICSKVVQAVGDAVRLRQREYQFPATTEVGRLKRWGGHDHAYPDRRSG